MKLVPSARVRELRRTLIREIFDSAPSDAINLGLGQPDLPTPPAIALAGIRAIAEGRTGYTSTAGDPALRSAVAELYRPFATGPEEVVITVGSQEALFAAMVATVDPGDEVLVPDPGYPAYPIVAALAGAVPVSYPLHAEDGFRLRVETIAERLGPRTRLVVLCAPSNPTGACHDARALAELVDRLAARGVPWLSDEVYAGFVWNEGAVSPSRLSRGGIVIGGLSKDASMTGWRIGWLVAPAELCTRVIALHQYLVTCAPAPSQAAALAALGPEGVLARERLRDVFARRREVMGQALAAVPRVRYAPPDGAFYYFVDVRSWGSSLDLARRLIDRRRVITIPGEAFGASGQGWLRLSFAAAEADIREGVRRIAAELAGAPEDPGP